MSTLIGDLIAAYALITHWRDVRRWRRFHAEALQLMKEIVTHEVEWGTGIDTTRSPDPVGWTLRWRPR